MNRSTRLEEEWEKASLPSKSRPTIPRGLSVVSSEASSEAARVSQRGELWSEIMRNALSRCNASSFSAPPPAPTLARLAFRLSSSEEGAKVDVVFVAVVPFSLKISLFSASSPAANTPFQFSSPPLQFVSPHLNWAHFS